MDFCRCKANGLVTAIGAIRVGQSGWVGLNNTIVVVLEAPLGLFLSQPDYGYLPAKVIATGVVVFWNYFANRYWMF